MVALGEPAHAVALPGLLDDLRDGAARRAPVLLLALEGRLDHLVGDVRRQPLKAPLGGRVVPEAEQRAQQLRDGERARDEGHDPGHRPEQGGRRARDRACAAAWAAWGLTEADAPAASRPRAPFLEAPRAVTALRLPWAAFFAFLRRSLPAAFLDARPASYMPDAPSSSSESSSWETASRAVASFAASTRERIAAAARLSPAGWDNLSPSPPSVASDLEGRPFAVAAASRLVERAGSLRDVSQSVALGLRDVARGEHVAALRPDHLEHPAALARAGHSYSSASRAARRISRSATSGGLVFHRS